MLFSIFTHFVLFVTPGRLPTSALFLPAKLFIKVLFPTLGTPITIALSGKFIPLSLFRSIFFIISSFILLIINL